MGSAALITGNSSGLGHALTERYLAQGWTVYGMSRRGCAGLEGDLHDVRCDLAHPEAIVPALSQLLPGVTTVDLLILNAGMLGRIRELTETPLEELLHIMQVNVWANKTILDWLHDRNVQIKQVVMISSGAAVNGHKGWGAYSLSKATLNMLAKLYAHEFPNTHFAAFAPGLIDTAMQDYLCDPDEVDAQRFPSVMKLRDARGTARMPTSENVARRIAATIPKLHRYPSGSFVDIRTLGEIGYTS